MELIIYTLTVSLPETVQGDVTESSLNLLVYVFALACMHVTDLTCNQRPRIVVHWTCVKQLL